MTNHTNPNRHTTQNIKIPNFKLNEKTGRYEVTRSLSDTQIINAARKLIAKKVARKTKTFTSPTDIKIHLILKMADYEQEVFACLWLDNRHRLIKHEELFYGTINSAAVYPREIVKRALHHNAAAVVLVHNHPSGDSRPSDMDKFITNRIKEAAELIDVKVLDHFIIGGDKITGFSEEGLM